MVAEEDSLKDSSNWGIHTYFNKLDVIEEGTYPFVYTDYMKIENLYREKYSVELQNKIKNTFVLSPFLCSTDLATYMIKQPIWIMQGTTHSDN